MKTVWVILCSFFVSGVLWAQTPATTNVPGAKYPAVYPDNRIEFRLKAPEAQKVRLDLGKTYDMQKEPTGCGV
uniref:CAZy families CBM48/CE1 protein n=1 Tax=uncultured Paludibacter sp. TaxID=497635 RepID=A0A060BPB5_9BACT|nr:CAZy families CBM48/CE1 protein [uncultured Paludibacter sp.]